MKGTWQYRQPARERLSPSCDDNDNYAGFDGSHHSNVVSVLYLIVTHMQFSDSFFSEKKGAC